MRSFDSTSFEPEQVSTKENFEKSSDISTSNYTHFLVRVSDTENDVVV